MNYLKTLIIFTSLFLLLNSAQAVSPLLVPFMSHSLVAQDACPGNFLTGEFRPRRQEANSWTIDMTNQSVMINKEDAVLQGTVIEMTCVDSLWQAKLRDMTDGVAYGCFADLIDNELVNGVCFTNYDKVVDITGTLSVKQTE